VIPRGVLGILVLAAPTQASSQSPSPPIVHAAGTVLRPSGADAVPVPNIRVVLHRVGRATQGPVDSMTTGPTGRFDFSVAPDSTATYLLSTRYSGIGYFSAPLPLGRIRSDTAVRLLVFDTSSTVPLATRSRTLVVSRPDAIGVRTVVDWFVVSNAANRTRVGRDTLEPTWRVRLPARARNAQVGDARVNQVSPEAVSFRADSMLVYAPFSPGAKELLIQYELPAETKRLEVPSGGADSLDLFLEEAGAAVAPGEWGITPQNFEGRQFRRFSRKGRPPATLTIRFPGLGIPPGTLLPLLVGAFGLGLAALSWRFLRARPAPAIVRPESAEPPPATLAAEVADLDRKYEGRQGDVTREEWDAYRARRERLIDGLEAALARRSPGA
jgi:hypothetical protein